jgi:hypothetical protein
MTMPSQRPKALNGCNMRHEENKQGLYPEKKITQLGQKRYDALFKRAHSIAKRSDAILALMSWLAVA